jgi:hypothetical protein
VTEEPSLGVGGGRPKVLPLAPRDRAVVGLLRGIEVLDGVAEHCARHLPGVRVEEADQ